jgi:hypothetical protein
MRSARALSAKRVGMQAAYDTWNAERKEDVIGGNAQAHPITINLPLAIQSWAFHR